ncbi:MAG: hypothetical protein ACOYOH_22405 [Paracraurococcus sp.]
MDWSLVLKVVPLLGIPGLVGAWVWGGLAGAVPPAPMVARAIHHRLLRWRGRPVADVKAGQYHLILCGLDGDDVREGTLRLLQHALDPTEYPMLHVTLAGRRIRRDPQDRERVAAAAAADRALRDYRADLVLWGEVVKQGDSLRLFLRGAGKQETQVLVFDKGLAKERPDAALGTVVCAVALSQVAPVTQEAGRYLAARLWPVVGRLEALLRDPRLIQEAERGALHHALGAALSVIGNQAGDEAALRWAVAAYDAALGERTRNRVPLDWAATQNKLGAALSTLGERGDDAALRRAVAAFGAALEERTRDRVPLAWATTQNNFGNALRTLGECGDEAALRRAVAAFEAALEERTRDRVPLDWATTQNYRGNALRTLGERGDDAALRRAVAAYEAALEVFRQFDAPAYVGMAERNLARASLPPG